MTTLAAKRILILGSGFGGLTAANLLRRHLSSEHRIVVVDKKEFFMMGLQFYAQMKDVFAIN